MKFKQARWPRICLLDVGDGFDPGRERSSEKGNGKPTPVIPTQQSLGDLSRI